MSDIMDRFFSAPPVSRTIVAAMFAESALVLSGTLHPHYIVFWRPYVFKLFPELWRLPSSFLLTGGGFQFVIDLYFTWTYASGLELNSPRFGQPGDFFTYVSFIASVILSLIAEVFPEVEEDYPHGTYSSIIRKNSQGLYVALAGILLKGQIFTQALLLAFIYTFAQDNRGKKAHFIILQIPVEYLPWAMLTLTFILGGTQATLQQGTGVIAAHLYDFLTRLYPTFQGGKNYIQTPVAIKRLFGADQSRFNHRSYGSSYQAGQRLPEQSRGWTSGFSSSSWGGRGSGRRLGGD